jgi:type IV pilus assembly protein PilZ
MGEETDNNQNRRRAPRVPVNMEVDYAADSTFLYAYITDISSMGIFIRTDEPCPPGTTLSLRFTPPEAADVPSEPLELEGEVKWNTTKHADTGDPGMGVEFIVPDDDMRERLLELVKAIAYLTGHDSDDDPSAAS